MITPRKTRKPAKGSNLEHAGPRTLADDIASIPPGGAAEAIAHEEQRKAYQSGVEEAPRQPSDPE